MLTQDMYDRLKAEWYRLYPEAQHFVLICPWCHLSAQPGHVCEQEEQGAPQE